MNNNWKTWVDNEKDEASLSRSIKLENDKWLSNVIKSELGLKY